MKSPFSRRDFLKVSGMALGRMALPTFLPGLSDFDDSNLLRIATDELPVRREPTDESDIVRMLHRDDLVHYYDLVKAGEPKRNPYWYRVWGGFIHRGRLHRVKTLYNVAELVPEGTRRLAEVTVPFTQPWRNTKSFGWEQLKPPLYYGSVHWVDQLAAEGPDGTPEWYRIFDELDSNVPYYVRAVHLRMLPPEMLEPISPDIPFDQKKIEVNLTTQILTAYEAGKIVFQTNVSSGIPGGGASGDRGISTTTPSGSFSIIDKYPSKHMGNSYFDVGKRGNLLADADGYVLPGIPWSCFFTEVGHAFHGTYWHENFGTEMSHGCVNMRSNEANWIFRWARPPHTAQAISNHTTAGTQVEIYH
ncbi:MAG: L,D-transpeptidase [Chloroflexota bacterium]